MTSEEIKLSDSMLEAMQNADNVAITELIPSEAKDNAAASTNKDNNNNNNIGTDINIGTANEDTVYSDAEESTLAGKSSKPVMIGPKGMRYYHNARKNSEDGFYYLIPDSKRILFLEFKIKRISNIDTSEETFRCAFHYYLTWLATLDDWNLHCDLESKNKIKDYVPRWTPKLSFVNVVDIHDRDSKTKYYIQDAQHNVKSMGQNEWSFANIATKLFGFPPWKGRWNRAKFSFEATFAEQFELDSFPFDCQDLSIVIKCDQFLSMCDILPFPRKKSDFISFDSSFSATGEWTYEGLLCEFSKTDKIHSKAKKEYSKVNISVKSKRNWRAHQSSFIIVACMFAIGLCTFSVDHRGEGIPDRLAFGITLLLADVATMQFIFGNVPNIPYFTLFDKYVHYCFRFLFAIIVWCSILGVIERVCADFDDILGTCDDTIVVGIDWIMFLVFVVVFVVCHVYLWRLSRFATLREISKVKKTSRELELLFDHTRHLVISEKKVMYVNTETWEKSSYILNESQSGVENVVKEAFVDDIVGFANIRQTAAQAQREKTRKNHAKHARRT